MTTYYRSDDAGAPQMTTVAGSLDTVLNAVLCTGYGVKPGAGWSRTVLDATNKCYAYTQGALAGMPQRILSVEDNNVLALGTASYWGCSAVTASSTSLTFDPAAKSIHMVLSNGNLTATSDGTAVWFSAKATQYKSNGKWGAEFTIGAGSASMAVGIAQLSSALENYLGSEATSYAYHKGGIIYNNVAQVQSALATYTTGDIITVLVDNINHTLIFWKNGVPQGTPITIPTTNWVPGVSFNAAGTITANFGASAFTYALPAGYVSINNIVGTQHTNNFGPNGNTYQGIITKADQDNGAFVGWQAVASPRALLLLTRRSNWGSRGWAITYVGHLISPYNLDQGSFCMFGRDTNNGTVPLLTGGIPQWVNPGNISVYGTPEGIFGPTQWARQVNGLGAVGVLDTTAFQATTASILYNALFLGHSIAYSTNTYRGRLPWLVLPAQATFTVYAFDEDSNIPGGAFNPTMSFRYVSGNVVNGERIFFETSGFTS
jgi:hypothetical protein